MSAPSTYRPAAVLRAALAALAVLSALSPRALAFDARRKQDIHFSELPNRTVDDGPFTLLAKSTSGLHVTFEVISGPAVLDGRTLKLTGVPGLVIIRAAQAGNMAFLPALEAERAFTVNRRPTAPRILAQPMGTRASLGGIIFLAVEADGEPLPRLQWRKDGVPIPGATDPRLTVASAAASDAGDYDVVASNSMGSAMSQRARVMLGRRSQTISFQGPASAIAGQAVMLSANASSGLPVHFDVISGLAMLSGTMMTPQGGTVVVQASQPGDSTYDAATPVTQSFVISVGPNGLRVPQSY
jgi:hypothetical protein